MERLQALLKEYITGHALDFAEHEWTNGFTEDDAPVYWQTVYSIAKQLPTHLKVVEIGSGFGFVLSIFKYLGYDNVVGYEQDDRICAVANQILKEFFDDECVKTEKFCSQQESANILVLVNCVYADDCVTKEEYMKRLVSYYQQGNQPEYYILEVIDSSYSEENAMFPEFIRLSEKDIHNMFPGAKVKSWHTYKYPFNKKSKTLYLIERP